MAEMKILELGGIKNSLDDLQDLAFTQDNRGAGTAAPGVGAGLDSAYAAQRLANTTLDDSTPRGLLAGSVVAMTGDREIGHCNGDLAMRPLGLLINDVAGKAFENTPAVASGKGPYLHAGAEVLINVYETVETDGTTPITYAAGDLVYCSPNGLVSQEASVEGTVLGVVKKVPTAADPFLGLQLFI